jgi:hypothetical protein
MIHFLLWLLGFYRPAPPPDVSNCPDFVDPDEGITWLDHPDEIENARWFAQGCYDLPAAKR